MSFGDTLRDLLNSYGITQKQLAMKLNIAPSTLGNYIQNSREPDFETLKALADYFKVSVDYLIGHPSGEANNIEEENLLCIYRALSPEQKEIFIAQGRAIVNINQKHFNKTTALLD